jgi:hypothetical protein
VARHRHRRRHRGHGGDPLLRQAQLETQVRYGPEVSALQELLHQARQDLRQGIAAESGAAEGIKAAANAARPEITRIYGQAGQTQQQANQDVSHDLSTLSSAADPYRAVTSREAAGAKRRLSEAFAGAATELEQRKIGAEQGRAYAVRNHLAQYHQDVGQIHRRRQQLAGEAGAFAQSDYQSLVGAQQKLGMEQARLNATLRGQDITIRGQNLTARDRRTKNRIAKQRLQRSGPGGKPRFTTVQLTRARSQWHKGVTYANILKSKGFLGKHPNESVAGLTRKGIDEPIARGVVQTLLYGGVRPHHRRFLEHNYGLRPKIASRFRRGNVFGHSFPVNLFGN